MNEAYQQVRAHVARILAKAESAPQGAYHQQPMALLIASDLHKDMAGQPLLRGVSFKLERRERMTIAGRNGAGKTTLLRMLAGETSIDRGELSVAKGVRVAARPAPAARAGPGAARVPALGLRRGAGIEAELAELESRWRSATVARRRWPATRGPRRAWRLAAATCGAIARP